MTTAKSGSIGHWIAAGIALVFSALTIFSGGQALFGGLAAQAAAGNAVPFVLWFNFLSGFVYALTGIGIVLRKPWGGTMATALAFAIVAVFALFGWYILRGGEYEVRTVGAMTLRATVWISIAVFCEVLPSRVAGLARHW